MCCVVLVVVFELQCVVLCSVPPHIPDSGNLVYYPQKQITL